MSDITNFIWLHNREVAAYLTFAAIACLFAGIVLWNHGITRPYVLASIFGWMLIASAIAAMPMLTGVHGWERWVVLLVFVTGLASVGLQHIVVFRRRVREGRAI